jgi:hypothetical protein
MSREPDSNVMVESGSHLVKQSVLISFTEAGMQIEESDEQSTNTDRSIHKR